MTKEEVVDDDVIIVLRGEKGTRKKNESQSVCSLL
jgi:hypothetical protein